VAFFVYNTVVLGACPNIRQLQGLKWNRTGT
jgi:hypothetical protein